MIISQCNRAMKILFNFSFSEKQDSKVHWLFNWKLMISENGNLKILKKVTRFWESTRLRWWCMKMGLKYAFVLRLVPKTRELLWIWIWFGWSYIINKILVSNWYKMNRWLNRYFSKRKFKQLPNIWKPVLVYWWLA